MADASTHELVGCEVTLKGLNAKPELNGRLGKVKAWLPDRGRLQVKLLDDDGVEDRREAPLAVKPDNVEKVDIADKFRNMKVNNGRTGISASAAADACSVCAAVAIRSSSAAAPPSMPEPSATWSVLIGSAVSA